MFLLQGGVTGGQEPGSLQNTSLAWSTLPGPARPRFALRLFQKDFLIILYPSQESSRKNQWEGVKPLCCLHQLQSARRRARNGGTHIVVGVQDSRDVLCQVSIQHSLDVIAYIDCRKRQYVEHCISRDCPVRYAQLPHSHVSDFAPPLCTAAQFSSTLEVILHANDSKVLTSPSNQSWAWA